MVKIKNEMEYKATCERIDELLMIVGNETPVSDKNFIELNLISDLVADYEEEHFPVIAPSLPELLRYKMAEFNISQTEIAKRLGVSQSRVSEYITGKAEPTLKVARLMCKELDITPALILGI